MAGFTLLLFLVFSLRCEVFCAGGLGLFCIFLEEVEEELGGVDLFAFGSVDFFKESGDEFVFKRELLGQMFDLPPLLFDLFFEGFDSL